MYRATKQWQLNQYVNLLVREGVLYFSAFFLLNFINLLSWLGLLPKEGWQKILYLPAMLVPASTLTPRFVISMRELYAHNVRREGISRSEIDTRFGLLGRPGNGSAVSTMWFADAVDNIDLEDPVLEDVPLMEVGNSNTMSV